LEHLFGAFEAAHYYSKERPNSVRIVHPKTGEEAWSPLHDEPDEPLSPELMAELDAIMSRTLSGLMIRRERKDRKVGVPPRWITAKGGVDYLRATVKETVRAATLRDDLSLASFRHGGFTEAADTDRRPIARGRGPSVSEAAPDLRQTHT
jgi:hypothetical protein